MFELKKLAFFFLALFISSTSFASNTPPPGTNGQCIINSNGKWGAQNCAAGNPPALPSGSLQYNDNGSFGAVSTGASSASTAQGALSALMFPAGVATSASFIVAACNAFTDQNTLATAEALAYATRTSILIPVRTNGSFLQSACILTGQWQLTHATVSLFAWPVGPTYDINYSFNGLAPTMSINAGSFSASNNCVIDMNGNNFSMENINFVSTFNALGTVAICNSVNGGGHGSLDLAILNMINSSISQFGNAVGCALNTSTGACTGTLGNNLISVRALKSIFTNNWWAFNGNFSDFFVEMSEFASNVYGAVLVNTFSEGGGTKFISNRVEYNSSTGTYGALNFNGVIVDNTVANNNFDHNYNADAVWINSSHFTVTGNSHLQSSFNDTSGLDAAYVLDSSSAGAGHITFNGESFYTFGTGHPKYLFDFEGTTDDYITINGCTGGPDAYSVSALNFAAETPAHLVFDCVGENHIEVGRNFGIGTTAPRAGFDAYSQTNAMIPTLIAPSGALTPLVVASSNNTNSPTSNNTAYWAFSNGSGSTVTDQIGGANGTWEGTLGSQWTTGHINSAGAFDGSTNYVLTTYAGVTGTGARSINMWVKTTTSSTTLNSNDLIFYGTIGTATDFHFSTTGKYGNPSSFAGLAFTASGSAIVYSSPNLFDGNWHMVTLTMPASPTLATMQFYLDGQLLSGVVHSANTGQAINTGTVNAISLGGSPVTSSFFTGDISDVGYWSRQLTANEILFLYNGGAGNAYPYSAESQSANLTNWTDQSSNILTSIGTSGHLGIGTSNPLGPLQVLNLGTSAPIGTTTGAGTVCADSNRVFYIKLSGGCP